jgi:lipopolysaccharide transport system ATP-binding protein
MSRPAIHIEGLSKKFRIGARQEPYRTLREAVVRSVTAPWRRSMAVLRGHATDASEDEIWALKDVSFGVNCGEVVGIIGCNGAGKSTLLRILSRITEPTDGRVCIKGRVGSLLEVGTGFHPELTGRENVYLNGAILGMRKTEIDAKFDEIVEFSELAKFLDTPVKHFSSGMYMRLAFAVAAHLEPEILLVDEVLAVGDAAFQKKCLGKMDDVARQGRTVVFVSHNLPAVQNLCERVVWLNEGHVVKIGTPGEVIDRYMAASLSTNTERIWQDPATAPGNERVRLHRVCVRPVDGSSADPITCRTPFVLEFEYWNLKLCSDFYVGFELYDARQLLILGSGAPRRRLEPGLYRTTCPIPADVLNSGTYRVRLHLAGGKDFYRQDDALVFDLRDSRDPGLGWYGAWKGILRLQLDWTTNALNAREKLRLNDAFGRAATPKPGGHLP